MDAETWSSTLATTLDPVSFVRTFFLLKAATILFILSVPAFRNRFFTYGARALSGTDKKDHLAKGSSSVQHGHAVHVIELLLDHLAAYTVPHSWFLHFYAFSVLLSIFWAYQITAQRYFFVTLAQWVHTDNSRVTAQQSMILWWCLFVQGCRRLIECVQGPKSASRMWIGHWIIGMVFYAATSIAIWIEGSKSLLFDKPSSQSFLQTPLHLASIVNIKLATGLLLFSIGAVAQNRAHAYLFNLRKAGTYTFPNHPLFWLTLTPHYFAECVEYVGLAIAGAPPGQYVNKTLACALVFVVVNLGVTAHGTYGWYAERFGHDMVKGKAKMVPLIW